MADRPNVLLVTTDHLRYDTLGVTGNPVIRTPAIDGLASEGVLFRRFFSQSPVCQPSRATFMTGRYPRNHGVRWNGDRLNENEMTLPEFFRGQGYATACVGKHHIAQSRFRESLDHVAADKIRRGWEERPDGLYIVDDPNPFERYVKLRGYEYRTGYALPDFRENLGAIPSDLPEDCHLDAYVGMKTREYLEGVRGDPPFFLWMGFYGPHHPYVPSGRFAHMYDPQEVPPFHRAEGDLAAKPVEYRLYRKTPSHKYRGFDEASDDTFRHMKAAYYGMISQLDWQLGQTLETLARRGLAENTIVVFLSDHGEFTGDHGIPAKAPFLLDCMLHVPCIIRAPGGQVGVGVDGLTESVDLFPTLTRLAGFDPPDHVQGRDQSGVVVAGKDPVAGPRQAIYAEAVDKRAIRTDRWKYIHYPGRPQGELYDVEEDPHELANLWDRDAATRERMRDLYHAVMDATEDFRHPSYQRFDAVDPKTGEPVTHYLTW